MQVWDFDLIRDFQIKALPQVDSNAGRVGDRVLRER